MEEPNDRLRKRREKAGYKTANDAARAFGWNENTYKSHESGIRGLKRSVATRYAKAFRTTAGYLLTGQGDPTRRTVPVVGYVGAGAEIYPFDDPASHGIDEVEAPQDVDENTVAVIVRGDSMFPVYKDGDTIYYRRGYDFIEDECIGQECIVQIKDGPIFIKTIIRGSAKNLHTLTSYNAPPRENVQIAWAAPVGWVQRKRQYARTG